MLSDTKHTVSFEDYKRVLKLKLDRFALLYKIICFYTNNPRVETRRTVRHYRYRNRNGNTALFILDWGFAHITMQQFANGFFFPVKYPLVLLSINGRSPHLLKWQEDGYDVASLPPLPPSIAFAFLCWTERLEKWAKRVTVNTFRHYGSQPIHLTLRPREMYLYHKYLASLFIPPEGVHDIRCSRDDAYTFI